MQPKRYAQGLALVDTKTRRYIGAPVDSGKIALAVCSVPAKISFSNYFVFLIAHVADNILSLLALHMEATHHLIKAKSLL
jgi:hypothetical protein